MCGIAGISSEHLITAEQIEKTHQSLQARGPDGWGVESFAFSRAKGWTQAPRGSMALLQTRLSIQDLSEQGAQPMSNEDGSLWIVYNGEIYGWEEEAILLREQGHYFKSRSDTEFILHAYEEWGDAALEHLRGMFAFCIFDLKKHRLFLARDRLGEKPLFYSFEKGVFAFASTLQALARLRGRRASLNPEAIDAFLTHRYIPAPHSLLSDCYKLPAAHQLVVSLSEGVPTMQAPHEYWQATPRPDLHPAALLRESITLRLTSDRPLGLFLSSGIDSQVIASLLAQENLASRVPTFTASFPVDPLFDEALGAQAIAHRLGAAHTTLPITTDLSVIEKIIEDLDEPLADPSAIPMWSLCQAAAREITVALTGDGGDELFAGYKRYQVHAQSATLLPRHGRKREWYSQHLCLKTTFLGRVERVLLGYQLGWESAYTLRFSGFDPLSRAFLQPDFSIEPHYWRLPSKPSSPREWMLECDRLNYLPEYILRKSDLCSMAHGLELRSPMLDHLFFQSVLGMPWKDRFTNPPKQFLKQLIGPHLFLGPKRGFNPPLHSWLHQSSLHSTYQELPDLLSVLTNGQLSATRLHSFLQLAHRDQRFDELTWMLLLLTISLRKFQEKI